MPTSRVAPTVGQVAVPSRTAGGRAARASVVTAGGASVGAVVRGDQGLAGFSRPASAGHGGPTARPRGLHPGVVWVWAAAVAVAASRTTNPLLHVLILAGLVLTVLVGVRLGPPAPAAGVFGAFVRLGAAVIVVRVAFGVVFGADTQAGRVLVDLPTVPMPAWAGGVSIGGPVTSGGLLAAVAAGLWLTTVLGCVGAANALADPRDLLRSLPGAFYEIGVSVVVALSFAPRLVEDGRRARTARRLRGQPDRGLRAVSRSLMPVLEGGIDSAIDLAASMDARGYGRRGPNAPRRRRVASWCLLGSLVLLAFGLFGLAGLVGNPVVAIACVLLAVGAAVAGLVLGSTGRRTRFRRAPWSWGELVVTLASATLVASYAAAVTDGTAGIDVDVTVPATWVLPAVPALTLLLVGAPAVVLTLRGDRVSGRRLREVSR